MLDHREDQYLTVDHAIFVNDLLSFRAECFRGDYFNAVSALLRTAPNMQTAIDTLSEMIAQADQELIKVSDTLRRRYPDQDMHAYIDALNLFTAGNLHWSLETTRYNGTGYGWNGLRSGTVTLRPGQTSIS